MIFEAIEQIRDALHKSLNQTFPDLDYPIQDIAIERPKNLDHGDFSSNIAMKLPSLLHQPPLKIAEQILENIESGPWDYSIAKPGFINVKFHDSYIFDRLLDLADFKDQLLGYNLGRGEKVQIEFISANPTGPLNVVNARAASVGDCLGNLFKRFGFKLEKEYYINDAGNQVRILGESIELAIRKLSGDQIDFPEDYYAGDYIFDLAEDLKPDYDKIEDPDTRTEFIRDSALEKILAHQKQTVNNFRLRFDNWFSEKTLYDNKRHKQALARLKEKNLIYDKDGATWIKTTELGDSQDWVLIKSNGDYTYLMGDIAYHLDKFERGFNKAINIWGPDHQAGVNRLQSALTAFGIPRDWLEILIIQQVNLIRGGERVKISKRRGVYETLEKLIAEVGVDPARFTFLLRTTSSHLDFDIDLVKQQVSENPVYYVQYAHARLSSIFRKARESGIELDLNEVEPAQVINDETKTVLRKIFEYPLILESALISREPSRLTNYAMDLADEFHSFYHNYRIITDDKDKSQSRLLICKVLRVVFKDILNLVGIKAPEQM